MSPLSRRKRERGEDEEEEEQIRIQIGDQVRKKVGGGKACIARVAHTNTGGEEGWLFNDKMRTVNGSTGRETLNYVYYYIHNTLLHNNRGHKGGSKYVPSLLY